eukprot:PITA_36484
MKNVEFKWTDGCQKAFNELKHQLSTTPILRGPNWAFPFHISSDASDTAIGAVLGQEENNLPYAIYFISKNMTHAELNYTTEKEFLAVIYAINKFRHYIIGYTTFVHTDHSAIKYLMNKSVTNARVTRWLLLLQEFDITIVDRPGLDQEIRRCIREDEVYDILKACHDGPCGGHFADKRTTHKVLRMGYYWPSLLKDAKKYVRAYDSYPRTGQPNHRDEMPLNPQVIIEPFERWALDFIGPINPPSNQRVYILVCTNYMTKWVEAKALLRANEESVLTFLFEEIFVRFGLPRELVTDGGPPFNSHGFKDTLQKYHIEHKMTTPYHPQANG